MSMYETIANLKGPQGRTGQTGPRGLPGAEGVPTDAAVAALAGALDSASGLALAAHYRTPRPPMLTRKIRGASITVKPSGGSWIGLWQEWDWDNWIKPQVDRAIAAGLNTVRLIGSPESTLRDQSTGVLEQITQAAYLDRWSQLATYCAQNGLYLYPCLSTHWDIADTQGGSAPWDFVDSVVTGVIVASAERLAEFSNVIGFDIYQEFASDSGMTLTALLDIYDQVRAVARRVPLTSSVSSSGYGSTAGFWRDVTSVQYQAATDPAGMDFVDMHLYLDPPLAPSLLDGWISRTGKPVLIGEFGGNVGLGETASAARYAALLPIHNRPGVLGSLAWALADQSTTDSDRCGLWDNSGFAQPSWPSATGETPLSVTSGERTYMTDILRQFAVADVYGPYIPQNMLTRLQAQPINSHSGWQAGSNTAWSDDPRGLGFVSSAAGGVSVNTFPYTAVPVVASAWYKVRVDVLSVTVSRVASLTVQWYQSDGTTWISASTASSGNTNTISPTSLAAIVQAPANAAYGVLRVQVAGTAAASEKHLVLALSEPTFQAI